MNLFWLSHRTVVWPLLYTDRPFLAAVREFPCHWSVQTASWPTRLSVGVERRFFLRRQSGWRVTLITNLHVILKSIISGAIPSLYGQRRDKFMFFRTLNFVFIAELLCVSRGSGTGIVCTVYVKFILSKFNEVLNVSVQWTGRTREGDLIEAVGRHRRHSPHIYGRQDMCSDFSSHN
jgi:hypothetical protein